jgi:hypothetical protein
VLYVCFSFSGEWLYDALTGTPSEKQEKVKIRKMFPEGKANKPNNGTSSSALMPQSSATERLLQAVPLKRATLLAEEDNEFHLSTILCALQYVRKSGDIKTYTFIVK